MTMEVNSARKGGGRRGTEHLNFLVVFEAWVSKTGLENSDTLSKRADKLS